MVAVESVSDAGRGRRRPILITGVDMADGVAHTLSRMAPSSRCGFGSRPDRLPEMIRSEGRKANAATIKNDNEVHGTTINNRGSSQRVDTGGIAL